MPMVNWPGPTPQAYALRSWQGLKSVVTLLCVLLVLPVLHCSGTLLICILHEVVPGSNPLGSACVPNYRLQVFNIGLRNRLVAFQRLLHLWLTCWRFHSVVLVLCSLDSQCIVHTSGINCWRVCRQHSKGGQGGVRGLAGMVT